MIQCRFLLVVLVVDLLIFSHYVIGQQEPVNTAQTVSSFITSTNRPSSSAMSGSNYLKYQYYGVYGPDNWLKMFPICDARGSQQSPVNIDEYYGTHDDQLTEIAININPPSVSDSVTMFNNGHTVIVAFRNAIHLSGGELSASYRVAGVHFHWGTNETGSEHTINGVQYAMEMHVVSYDESRFDDVGDALNAPGGLAVLAVMFTISTQDNAALSPIIANLKNVKTPAKPINIPYIDLLTLLPSDRRSYFRYLGSLTAPPCSTGVIWTVYYQTLSISDKQLAEFRSVYEDVAGTKPLTYNYRPLQPLLARRIRLSYSVPVDLDEAPFVILNGALPGGHSGILLHLLACLAIYSTTLRVSGL